MSDWRETGLGRKAAALSDSASSWSGRTEQTMTGIAAVSYVLAQRRQELPAVPTGHDYIQHDHIGRSIAEHAERALDGAGVNRPVPTLREDAAEEVADVRVVVDDQAVPGCLDLHLNGAVVNRSDQAQEKIEQNLAQVDPVAPNRRKLIGYT